MAKASGSIDLKAGKAAHDDAATKATKYITRIDGDGIFVSPENNTDPTTSNPGNSALINADGMEIFNDGDSVAKYGQVARIGKDNGMKFVISPDRIYGVTPEKGTYFNLEASSGTAQTKVEVFEDTVAWRWQDSVLENVFMSDSITYTVDLVVHQSDVAEHVVYSHIGGTSWTGTVASTKTSGVTFTISYNNTAHTMTVQSSQPSGFMYRVYSVYAIHEIAGSVLNIGSSENGSDTNAFVTTMGQGLIPPPTTGGVAIGNYNTGADALFAIGNGTSTERKDVLTVDANGAVTHRGDRTSYTPSMSIAEGVLLNARLHRYGRVVQLSVQFRTDGSIGAGENMLDVTLNEPAYRPTFYSTGCAYYGNHAVIAGLSTAGNLIVRNASTTAVNIGSNSNCTVSITYII